MTLLGKVMIFVILLLSIIFFAASWMVNQTHRNNRIVAEDLQKKLSDAEVASQQLQEQLDLANTKLAIEATARRSVLSALQTELTADRQELAQLQGRMTLLQSTHTELDQTHKELVAKREAEVKENADLRKQLMDALEDRDLMHKRCGELTDSFYRTRGSLAALEERYASLAFEHTSAREKLDILGIKPETRLDGPPPGVNGLVTALSTNGRVEINLGKDDGIRVGNTLEVSRNYQYLGRIKILTVSDNSAVGEILSGYQKGFLREGDRVDSKLY